ncbi:MAG: tryptophan transporter [Candidatus Fermentithermobacillus carboniphilus]|uniref:Tryptophan transporter n=1 Tax=Candidatus Fermentithermobacillus carboniphilus TaxID=3085328 RepID=A0AAT9LEH1_9FIRM|nr:MAG: tryptophan transporter [Candidatus Fermentithermobacillus carboniphilus]
MRFRSLLQAAILLAVGLVVHQVTPPILFGMKPDFLLGMMFIIILMEPTPQEVLVVGLLSGILTALTTSFPGGQFGNMVDKPVTAFVAYGLTLLIKKAPRPVKAAVVSFVGTIVSGATFLAAASLVTDLGKTIPSLLLAVVLPAAVINMISVVLLYPVTEAVVGSVRRRGESPDAVK